MPRRPSAAANYSCRTTSVHTITLPEIHAWRELESRAAEPNAYASPLFVLPAVRHLAGNQRVDIVLIERHDVGLPAQLVGVAALVDQPLKRQLPLPHKASFQSQHSFCGAPLIDSQSAVPAWCVLLTHLSSMRWQYGLSLPGLDRDGVLLASLQQACDDLGLDLQTHSQRTRAMLVPADSGPDALRRQLRKQYNEIERCRRRFSEHGQLKWQIHRTHIPTQVVEDFLRLEHCGWKGDAGSSLRSHPHEEAFFREMIDGFALEGRALFTELCLGDQVIASTSNLVSGRMGFAFKVGWDPAWRKLGVGILGEAELVRYAPEVCADLERIDSGAEPESFIEKLWPDRRDMVTARVLFNAPAAWLARQTDRLFEAGRRLRSRTSAQS